MINKQKGMVYLIGAGPGDPGLITVKGLSCIKQADVIVYDRLASPRLLTSGRGDAEYIFVGKGPDKHTLTQSEINQLLVDKAKAGYVVARLKGGDPFVFGRGGEEAEVLVQHGVPFEVVPGVTSAVAVPAYAGIPVTHRDFTSSLAIITGNEDPTKDQTNIDWSKISTGFGTLIFLMGMGNLPAITEKLIENGRSQHTPVALIRWGTRPEQQTLVGNLSNIAGLAKQNNFQNPAIIVVGEVVKLREKLKWFEDKPLFGKKVLVTRSREQASALSRLIEQLGGEPIEFPTISIEPPRDYTPLDQALRHVTQYNWIIFTSVNGVKAFFQRLGVLNLDIRNLAGVKICAIGPQTAKALQKMALQIDYVPEEYKAEAIVAGLAPKITAGDKVLLPRADIARSVLPESLTAMGAKVDDVVAYRTVAGAGNAPVIRDLFTNKQIDIITFTSSSTVRNFATLLGDDDPVALVEGVKIACIGPITAQTALDLGFSVDIQAPSYTINGLVSAILDFYQSNQ